MRGLRGDARQALAWPRIMDAWGHLVPRYPGPDVVPLARVPGAPRLDPDEPLPVRVLAVVHAYQATTRHFFGPWVGSFPKPVTVPELRKHRYARLLNAATERLTELRRAPHAWCAFSASVWRSYHGRGGPKAAPIPWVLSLKRIDTREEWFAWEETKYAGGRVFIVPAQRELMDRYEGMRLTLLRQPLLDAKRVRKIVGASFPDGLYERLVDDAREQVSRRVDALHRRVQRGGFIW